MTQTLTRLTKYQKGEERSSAWFIMDAKGKVLGRLATAAAKLLIGKDKTSFTPGVSSGSHVVIINAKEIAVTGRKEEKKYFRHSGYPGGLKETNLKKMREAHPERILEHAIKGMLPKNRTGSLLFKNLHVYGTSQHEFSRRTLTEVK